MHTLLIYHYLSLAEGCTVGSDTVGLLGSVCRELRYVAYFTHV